MSKLINYVGYSRVNGELKFRTAATSARVEQLSKLGDTDVHMTTVAIETDSKSQAAAYCLTVPFFADAPADVIALFKSIVTAQPTRTATAKTTAKTTRTATAKTTAKKVTAQADDAPYTAQQAARIRAEFMRKLEAVYEAN